MSFSDFSGEIMMYWRDYDVITREFPPKLGKPPDFRPISSGNVHSDNQTECNDTYFVQNFD